MRLYVDDDSAFRSAPIVTGVPNSIEPTAGVFCMLCANARAAAELMFGLICCGPPAKTVDVCGVSVSTLLVYGTVTGRVTPQNGSPMNRASIIWPTFIVILAFTICWSFAHAELISVTACRELFRTKKGKGNC